MKGSSRLLMLSSRWSKERQKRRVYKLRKLDRRRKVRKIERRREVETLDRRKKMGTVERREVGKLERKEGKVE